MRVILGFLSTIRFYVLIKAVRLASLVSVPASNWIGEVSGLNKVMLDFLEWSDRREGSAEPSPALYATSDRDQ